MSSCISHKLQYLLTEKNIYAPRILGISLRASSPGRFGGGAGKMEGELATMSLEFEYLHRKSQCEMLIGGDDISNDVMTIGTCFLCLFTFALVSFEPIGGEPQGKWRWNLNSRDVVASCPSFSRPAAKVPRRACS